LHRNALRFAWVSRILGEEARARLYAVVGLGMGREAHMGVVGVGCVAQGAHVPGSIPAGHTPLPEVCFRDSFVCLKFPSLVRMLELLWLEKQDRQLRHEIRLDTFRSSLMLTMFTVHWPVEGFGYRAESLAGRDITYILKLGF
jgi:hypothetical protein